MSDLDLENSWGRWYDKWKELTTLNRHAKCKQNSSIMMEIRLKISQFWTQNFHVRVTLTLTLATARVSGITNGQSIQHLACMPNISKIIDTWWRYSSKYLKDLWFLTQNFHVWVTLTLTLESCGDSWYDNLKELTTLNIQAKQKQNPLLNYGDRTKTIWKIFNSGPKIFKFKWPWPWG